MTLAELVVVIAVVGFLSAMIIPAVSGVLSDARETTARRNAQNIAMVASVAVTIGNDEFREAQNLEEAIDRLISGVQGINSPGGYHVGQLSVEERQMAEQFLRFENAMIHYDADSNGIGGDQGGGSVAGGGEASGTRGDGHPGRGPGGAGAPGQNRADGSGQAAGAGEIERWSPQRFRF